MSLVRAGLIDVGVGYILPSLPRLTEASMVLERRPSYGSWRS